MPEHTSLLHYVMAEWFGPLKKQAHHFSSIKGHHLTYRDFEPLFMSLLVMLVILYLTTEVRRTYRTLKVSTVPETELTLRTFFEAFFAYFYGVARDVMGPKSAKRYFPLIGSAAIFIFASNASGLIPGFSPPTSNLNITAGMALIVYIAFNYYGIKENGLGYLKHMAGWGVFHGIVPNILLAIVMFPIELISITVRPVTLAIRLMLNIAVDHLLVSIFLGLFAVLLPLPIMMLGCIVIAVQTLVFCLLTSIYIGLATAHEEGH